MSQLKLRLSSPHFMTLSSLQYGLMTVRHLQVIHSDRIIMISLLINCFGCKLSVMRVDYYISSQWYMFSVCFHYVLAEWCWNENWRFLILHRMTAMYFHKCMSILTWNCYFSSEVIIVPCESRPWEWIIIMIWLFEIMVIIIIIFRASYVSKRSFFWRQNNMLSLLGWQKCSYLCSHLALNPASASL